MRPVPRVGERLQGRECGDVDGRDRARRAWHLGVLSGGERDQHQPGPDPVPGDGRRREQPGEVGFVELDRGQVVRLEVRRVLPRLGAYDVPGVEAEHVTWPIGLHGQRRDRMRARCRVVGGDRQADADLASRGQRAAVVGIGQDRRHAPAGPGQEVVGARAVAHGASSCVVTTWTAACSPGLAAR